MAALPLYSSPIHSPARLAAALSTAFPGARISTPASSRCSLTATQNVIGRAANGVPLPDVCVQPARVHDVDGTWLHAEQSGAMRDGGTYGLWVSAVKAAVDPVVVDGKEAPGEESGRGDAHPRGCGALGRSAFLPSSRCVKGAPRRTCYMTDQVHSDVR